MAHLGDGAARYPLPRPLYREVREFELNMKSFDKLNDSKKKKERDPLSLSEPDRAKIIRLENVLTTDHEGAKTKENEAACDAMLGGHPLNIVTDDERSKQLLDAAFSKNLSELKRLVNELGEQQQDVAATVAQITDCMGRNALHLACDRVNLRMCEYLVREVKLDPNITDSTGYTPLVYAYGSTAIGKLLIENGADPNAAIHNYAARSELQDSVINVLIVKVRYSFARLIVGLYRSPLGFLLSEGAEVNALFGGLTPLHTAAATGVKDNVETLLENGADPNNPCCILSPLMKSTMSCSPSLECVEMLLKAGADPNINASGDTPLHAAASLGRTCMIRSLLSANADPNITNDSGLTPLEVAAGKGREEAVRLLFPVTRKIPHIPIWMPTEVVSYAKSTEAIEKRLQKSREKAMASKLKGDEAFKREDYAHAAPWYRMAISSKALRLMDCDFMDTKPFTNLTLCYVHLNQPDLARIMVSAVDELETPEGYYLRGAVLRMGKDFCEAAALFREGLSLDPGNKKLQCALQECYEEIQRPGGMLSEVDYPTLATVETGGHSYLLSGAVEI